MSSLVDQSLAFEELNLSKKSSQPFYMDFIDDDSSIEKQWWVSKDNNRINLDCDLSSSTQYQKYCDSIYTPIEMITNESKEKEQILHKLIIDKKKKSIKKSSKNMYSNKKKDYKKNICGYITKTTVKQSFSKEIKPHVEQICDSFGINYIDFFQTFQDYSFITGPTHLDILITPKLKGLDHEQSQYEILLRIVFIVYYRWFTKNRYLRYMMIQGKMAKKGQYIIYLNKVILPILADEQNRLENKFSELFQGKDNYRINGKPLPEYIEHVYQKLIQQNSFQFEQKQEKIWDHIETKQIQFPTSLSENMEQKSEGSFFLNFEQFEVYNRA